MRPGEVIAKRYALLHEIGSGGMATVFRALDHLTGRPVAIKVLREGYSTEPKFVTRFQREAEAAFALRHPNIVLVLTYGLSQGRYYIVMELVEGTDLYQLIKREGTLDAQRAIEIAYDVALGLGMAHRRGIVHRDVKPPNILLTEGGLAKLTDFGIASAYRSTIDERLTTTGMAVGTALYSAPEQAQGLVVGPPADIYALGVVLYEMLCGRPPFQGESSVSVALKHVTERPVPPRKHNPHLDRALDRLVMRCLEKDPRHRYADGDTLAQALEHAARSPLGMRYALGLARLGAPYPTNGAPGTTANGPRSSGTPPGFIPPQVASLADQETARLASPSDDITSQETRRLPPRTGAIADQETARLPNGGEDITHQETTRLPDPSGLAGERKSGRPAK